LPPFERCIAELGADANRAAIAALPRKSLRFTVISEFIHSHGCSLPKLDFI
jgi:hypothetical protein